MYHGVNKPAFLRVWNSEFGTPFFATPSPKIYPPPNDREVLIAVGIGLRGQTPRHRNSPHNVEGKLRATYSGPLSPPVPIDCDQIPEDLRTRAGIVESVGLDFAVSTQCGGSDQMQHSSSPVP